MNSQRPKICRVHRTFQSRRSPCYSKELFANAMKKALKIYAVNDKLEAAQNCGDAGAVIDVVKRILNNG